MCSCGDMAVGLVCDWVLFSYQLFKIRVNTILDITTVYLFSLDIPEELKRIFDSSLSSSGVGTKIIILKSSNDFSYSRLEISASLSEEYAWLIYC